MDLEPKTSSRLLFKDFPEELLEKMAARNLALHAHDWVISIDAYNRKQQLRDFYKILATDTFVDPLKDDQVETFVMAVEAKDYPIAGVMFHPETQTISVHSEDKQALKGKVNTADTDAIMYYFSDYVTR